MSAPAPQWVEAWDDATGADRAATAFEQRFGSSPQGVWAAPGRVNLIGEHTDYNGGLCLPIALPHRTFVALAESEPGHDARVRLAATQIEGTDALVETSIESIAPGAVTGWSSYVLGVPWALAERDARLRVAGFDAVIDSCVPFGAGLSSSAALEAAVAAALTQVYALNLPTASPAGGTASGTVAGDMVSGGTLLDSDAGRALLAAACVRAENEIAGAPTGGMDQAASLRCRAGHALLLDCASGEVRQIPCDLRAAGLALLVIDTRAPHALVDGQYAERRATCEACARRLGLASLREIDDLPAALAAVADDERAVHRVRHVVTEIARTRETADLMLAGRLREIGPLFDASHESLRLDYEVSCPELDLAVATARGAGALGARMTGGGFGGSAIALVDLDAAEPVAAAVAQAFATAGFTPPAFLLATPSAPAARVSP